MNELIYRNAPVEAVNMQPSVVSVSDINMQAEGRPEANEEAKRPEIQADHSAPVDLEASDP